MDNRRQDKYEFDLVALEPKHESATLHKLVRLRPTLAENGYGTNLHNIRAFDVNIYLSFPAGSSWLEVVRKVEENGLKIWFN